MDALARRRPLLIVFEDVHWIDPTTLELLARVERLPVLLLATYRPEFHPSWVGQAHVTVLALSRLGRRDGAALVQRLAGNLTGLADDIVDEIVERTDGVPLFLEEVTKAILETAEAATSAAARGAIATIPGARTAVPATLQASLLARLDRLGPAAREIAQSGAAIGRDFAYELVAAAAPRGEAETRAALDQLVGAGLVFQTRNPARGRIPVQARPRARHRVRHAATRPAPGAACSHRRGAHLARSRPRGARAGGSGVPSDRGRAG
jgi:predicted ATPase